MRDNLLLILFGAVDSVRRIDRNGLGPQLMEEGCGKEAGLAIIEFDKNDVSHFFCGHDARSGIGIHNELCNHFPRIRLPVEKDVLESRHHPIEAFRSLVQSMRPVLFKHGYRMLPCSPWRQAPFGVY